MDELILQFPALAQRDRIYFDFAATSFMPQCVIDDMLDIMCTRHGNIYRGVHTESAVASELYENSRRALALFLGAKASQILFTSGTTHGLNLVAYGVGADLGPKDRVLLSVIEHHGHLLPWQRMAQQNGFSLEMVSINDRGELCLDDLENININETYTETFATVINMVFTALERGDGVRDLGKYFENEFKHSVKVLVSIP